MLPSYSRRLVQRREKGNAFSCPRVWREHSNHRTDCYFCTKGNNARSIKYSDIPSSIATVPHNTTDILIVLQQHLKNEAFIRDASSTDSETKQSSAACFRCQLLVKGVPTKMILMVLPGTCHWQSRILSFYFRLRAMGLTGLQHSNYFTEKSDIATSRCLHAQKDFSRQWRTFEMSSSMELWQAQICKKSFDDHHLLTCFCALCKILGWWHLQNIGT